LSTSRSRSEILYPVLRRLVEAGGVQATYECLLSALLELSGAEDGFAAQLDRERGMLEPLATHGQVAPGPFSLEWGPAAQAVAATDARVEEVFPGDASLLPLARRVLYLPVPGPGGLRGICCLGRRGELGFDDLDLGLCTEIAEATAHLLNRRVTQAVREEELSLLWDVKRGMTDPDLDLDEANLSELLSKILRIALRRTGTQNGGIFLVEEDSKDVVIEQQAIRGDLLGRLPDRLVRRRDRGSGIVFWVIEHNRPYMSGDVTTDPYYLPLFRSIRSNLTVPLSFQDRAIGAIVVESVQPDFFTASELDALTDLARSATMFIRRAQLYRQTRREGRPGIHIKGSSPEWVEVERRVERAAATDATVLIRGESGTGKELLAHSIHFNSRRAKRPFVVVNAGALPESLLESELFGHVKGAFTGAVRDKAGQFELADGGTIFLDEIGDLSPPLQVKLLRTLQYGDIHKVGATDLSRRVDVRVIAATNRNLEEMVRRATFREDLYYRINVVPIWLPPLRRYRESIPSMARAFVQEMARVHHRPAQDLSPEALEVLLRYDWPGNVRELRNCLERAVILEETPLIQPSSLPAEICRGAGPAASLSVPSPAAFGGEALDYHGARLACLRQFEESYLRELLRRSGGNISRAAASAGISRVNLHRLLRKHGLRARELRGDNPVARE
jgi:transcriptional regulator with GAF, ATPase, and Fis domain